MHRNRRFYVSLLLLRRRRRSYRIPLIAGALALVLGLMAVPAVASQSSALASNGDPSTDGLPQDTLIYDRHGRLIADLAENGNHRIEVPLSAVSPNLIKATVAIEDRTFWTNDGIDLASIGRAALADFSHRAIVQGGSTITQQLVKQLVFGAHPPITFQRKLTEAILALKMTRSYSKDQILTMYLNTIYYGSQSYGIQAAAQSFFHKDARDLDLAQAAMLAGLPQEPSGNSPLLNPAQAKRRQAEVLQAMVDQHSISKAEASQALAEPLHVYPPSNQEQAPYFVDYVLQVLRKQFHIDPNDGKGYRVYTSLDLNLQHLAEQVITDQVTHEGRYYNFHDGALVSLDPKTGEVLAFVGGVNHQAPGGQINMALSPTRQPGSSFKIFTYTAAIESGHINMTSPILDQPLIFPLGGGVDGLQPYRPQNYDHRFHGIVPAKVALGNSLNIPALKVEMYTGLPAVLDAARRMGATSLNNPDSSYGISLTLGGYPVPVVEMATGAATLADLGVRHRPAPILTIDNSQSRRLYAYDPKTNAYQAATPQAAFIVDTMLSDDRNRCMEFGCGGDLTLPGRTVAAKTGTSQDFRDNWTIGFTPTLATAVWVGNPDQTPLSHSASGIVGAAPAWHQFMERALAATPNQWYSVPSGLVRIGNNYYLPGTQNLPPVLARSWPACHFRSYNPARLTPAQTVVNGVPCVIGY